MQQNILQEGWERMKVIGQRVKGCYRAAGNGTLGPYGLGREMVQGWQAAPIGMKGWRGQGGDDWGRDAQR